MEKIPFDEAIRAQPDTLRTSRSAVEAGLDRLPEQAWDDTSVLTILAMGASTNAAEALVHAARQHGRMVLNPPASVWTRDQRPTGDWVLAISESGRSPEPLQALNQFTGPRLALTNVPGSPITEAVDTTLDLGDVPDAGVYVTGYTGTLVALALLGERMGLPGTTDGLDEVPDVVHHLIGTVPDHLAELTQEATPPTFIDVVADPHSYSSAAELALLLREGARLPSAAHLTDQFLHGPAESLDPEGLLVIIGNDSRGLSRRFSDSHPTLHIASEHKDGEATTIRFPRLPQFASNILETVIAQLITAHLNAGAFTIGEFRHEFSHTKLPPT